MTLGSGRCHVKPPGRLAERLRQLLRRDGCRVVGLRLSKLTGLLDGLARLLSRQCGLLLDPAKCDF